MKNYRNITEEANNVSIMQTSNREDVILLLVMIGFVVLLPLVWAASPVKTELTRRIATILLGTSAVLLVFLAFLFDMLFGISASWFFSFGVWVQCLVSCLAVHLRYQSRFALIILCALTIFILIQHFLDLSPVKPYKRFFAGIRPGMTENELFQILHREFPTHGPFPVPVRFDFRMNEISFALNPTERAWNAEAIIVHLDHGRVVSTEYLRD